MISKLKKTKLLLLILVLIISGCTKKNNQSTNEIKEQPPQNVNQTIEESKKLTLFAVGDALIHNTVYEDANTFEIGEDGYYKYDFKKMFTYIKPLAKSHDLAFYNQETIIGGKELELSNYPMFNSPDEIGLDMIDSGFNIVNLATNHMLDRGKEGLEHSLEFWDKQDVYTAGSYKSWEERNNIEIKEKNGIKYAVLAYTYGTNGLPVPEGYEYMVNLWSVYGDTSYEDYKQTVKQDIERIRNKVDLLIVSMHWGNEYIHEPSVYERDAAEFLADQGVDIIIGTHPHVIQPIEYIGDTLVIYSLGNFLSAQIDTETLVGMMVSLEVEKDPEKDKIEIKNVKADLTWNYYRNFRDYKVIPFYELTYEELSNKDEIYEKYKQIINPQQDERIQVGF